MLQYFIALNLIILPVISSASDLRFFVDCGTLENSDGGVIANGPNIQVAKIPFQDAEGKWTEKFELVETDPTTGATQIYPIEGTGNGDEDYLEYEVVGSKTISAVTIQNQFRWARLSDSEGYTINRCDPVSQAYRCEAKANPARGFPLGFSIDVANKRPGSDIVMTLENGKSGVIGKVEEVTTIYRAAGAAFDSILGLIFEEDISGLKDVSKVDRIEVIQSNTNAQEVLVIRLLSNKTQVGGSVLTDMHGTNCGLRPQ